MASEDSRSKNVESSSSDTSDNNDEDWRARDIRSKKELSGNELKDSDYKNQSALKRPANDTKNDAGGSESSDDDEQDNECPFVVYPLPEWQDIRTSDEVTTKSLRRSNRATKGKHSNPTRLPKSALK